MKVRESDDRYRQLAEHVRDVVWLLEVSTGRVLYLNDAFKVVIGKPLNEPTTTATSGSPRFTSTMNTS